MNQKQPLTEKQTAVMRVICEAVLARRYPPSVREIARGAGCSPMMASGHVRRLVAKGWLLREPRRARALAIVDGPAAVLAEIGPDTEKIRPDGGRG